MSILPAICALRPEGEAARCRARACSRSLGRLKKGKMEIVSTGPIDDAQSRSCSFDYEERSVVHDAARTDGPAARPAPGPALGHAVVNPFTGQVEAGAGRGPAADAHPLERRAGERLRGGAACRARDVEDLGSNRRAHPPPGSSLPVRAARARPAAGRLQHGLSAGDGDEGATP